MREAYRGGHKMVGDAVGERVGVPWEQDMVECVFEIGKCSLCRLLNLTFDAICGEYSSCSRVVAILAVTNRIIRQDRH